MDSATIALIAALVGPIVAYLVAARRFSGKVGSTEAHDLWEESRSIREWSAKEIKELRDRIEVLEESNNGLLEDNRVLRSKVFELSDALERADKALAVANVTIAELEKELKKYE